MENKKKLRMVITALIAVAMVMVGVVAGYGLGRSAVPEISDVSTNLNTETSTDIGTATQEEQSENNGLSIMSLTEEGEWIVVKTSYLTIRYPFAFSDIIEVEAYNDGSASQLRFYSKLDDKRILNYVVHFNDNEGVLCGTVKLKEDIPVSVEFKEMPKRISDDWTSTFYAVQETFNDVLKSMEDNDNFSAVV